MAMKLLERWINGVKASDYIAWREKRLVELTRELTIHREKALYYRNSGDFANYNLINSVIGKLTTELLSLQTNEHVKRMVLGKEVVHGRY